MRFRYIFGRPGTGKTRLCMTEMISHSGRHKDDYCIYIVPEQFTLQTERELVSQTPGGAIMQIQVLSFERLTYHVFNEVGGNEKKILEDIGKSMLLRKIVGDLKNDLGFFANAVDKQGFMSQLFETVTEFYRYHMTGERLSATVSAIHNNETLRLKMVDLYKILESYQGYQSGHYIANDEKLDILAEKIERSALIKNAHIWIDGFNGFTPQEYQVLDKLFSSAKQVTVALAADDNTAEAARRTGGPDYFYEINNTVHRINEMLTEKRCAADEIIRLKEIYRLKDAPEIRHLAENFLSSFSKKYAQPPTHIKLAPCENIYAEIENAAAEILSLVREKDYRFKDIGILACSLEDYGKNIQAAFRKYGIPVFIDIKTDILSHPLIELVRSVFSMITEHWSYESVFRFLKTNLTPIAQRDVDLVENYVLSYGVKGGKWRKPWVYGFHAGYELFEQEHLNAIREHLLNIVSPLTDTYKTSKKYTVKEISERLFLFLETMDIGAKINTQTENQPDKTRVLFVREHVRIWGKLIQVLEKMVEILGEEKVTVEEYAKIIDAGLSEQDLGTIPPSLDQVIVGDLRRSRLPEIKALFVLGMNEGLLPSRFQDTGLLSDEDRIFLQKNHRAALAPNHLMKAYEEYYLIYTLLSKPSASICLSYYTGGLDGKSFLPSPIIKKIQGIFPGLTPEQKDQTDDAVPPVVSKRFAYNDFLLHLGSFLANGKIPPFYKDMYAFLIRDKEYTHRIETIISDYLNADTGAALKKDTVSGIYGKLMRTSVSRLEKYIQCPFSYFVQYNLKATERKLYEIESLNLGNLFHDVLDGFSKCIQRENIDWRTISDETVYAIASDCIDTSLEKESNEIFRNTPQYQYFAGRAKRIALRSIFAVIAHMRNGNFEFSYSEAAFDDGENHMGAIKIALGDGMMMCLEGRIDRVDLLTAGSSEYVKIIDYKSGSKVFSFPEIFYGLQLQLIIYLDAFIKKYKEKLADNGGGAVLPAAVLYFRLDNPLINFTDIAQKDTIETALYKKFKMSGVVLEDFELIRGLDNGIESKSDIIPVAIKSGGAFKKLPLEERPLAETSSALSADDFQKLMDFGIDKAAETGKRILTGEISRAPYKYGNLSGCGYCPYKAVCRFDPVINANEYTLMQTMKSKQAIQKILEKTIEKTIDKSKK